MSRRLPAGSAGRLPTPQTGQGTQQRLAHALIADELQQHRGELADHARVHTQVGELCGSIGQALDVGGLGRLFGQRVGFAQQPAQRRCLAGNTVAAQLLERRY